MKTTLDIDDSVTAELKREAERQGPTMSELHSQRKPGRIPALPVFRSGGTLVDIADRDNFIALPRRLECGRVPSADEIRALRRPRRPGCARAGTVTAAQSRPPAAAMSRGLLIACARALADGDGDRLAGFIATKLRRRCWPPEVVRALGSAAPTEGDFDLLADFVETIGRRPGGVRDQPLRRVARLADVLLSLLGRRVPDARRTTTIKYACETEGDDTGLAIEPERVRDLLNRPRARRQYY